MLHICFCIFAFAVFFAYKITILTPNPIICQENHLPIRVLLEIILWSSLDPTDRASRGKKLNSLRAETRPYWLLYPLSPGVWSGALPLVECQQVFIEQMTQCEAPSTKTYTKKISKLLLLIWIKMSERYNDMGVRKMFKVKILSYHQLESS